MKKILFGILVFVAMTIPFHYIPSELVVIPKVHWGFEHTIVTEKDLDKCIEYINTPTILVSEEMEDEYTNLTLAIMRNDLVEYKQKNHER